MRRNQLMIKPMAFRGHMIAVDGHGFYRLNDVQIILDAVCGVPYENKRRPGQWIQSGDAQEYIAKLEKSRPGPFYSPSRGGGTYVCEELLMLYVSKLDHTLLQEMQTAVDNYKKRVMGEEPQPVNVSPVLQRIRDDIPVQKPVDVSPLINDLYQAVEDRNEARLEMEKATRIYESCKAKVQILSGRYQKLIIGEGDEH